MIKRTILVFALLVNLSAYAEKVVDVHDGDTFTLSNGQKVRMFGIDAPELKQPFGVIARNYLTTVVKGKRVDLYCFDKSYKRAVCLVDLHGQSVQRLMVGHGLAYDNPHYSKSFYGASERWAKSRKRGVWVQPDGGVRPWDYRHPEK